MSYIEYPSSGAIVPYSGGVVPYSGPSVYNPQSGPVISYSNPGYGKVLYNIVSPYVTSDNVEWALNKISDFFTKRKDKNKQSKNNKAQQQVITYQPSQTLPPYTPFSPAPLPIQSLGNKYRSSNIASYWNPGYYDMFEGGGLTDPFLLM